MSRPRNAMLDDLRRHDPLTRAHSERVRGLAEVIGASLRLTAQECEKLRVASLLHDIGKLAVPRNILEQARRAHRCRVGGLAYASGGGRKASGADPSVAGRVGRRGDRASRALRRWRVPPGLAREEITLAGRIVAVADAYDCIVSSRSYKAASPVEQARAELAASSGTQFDPEIVCALLAVPIHRLHPSRT